MRNSIFAATSLVTTIAGSIGLSMAQGMPPGGFPGLANIKMVQAEPERAGDRALSCEQITAEIGQIMQGRNVSQAARTSKGKICSSRQVLNRQSNEKLQLSQAQNPALVAASLAPGPGTQALVAKVNAENMALEQRQQPARQQAMGEMMSGMGDMVAVFNDPRLMRLGLLMQERQCTMSAPAPPPDEPEDPCAGTGEVQTLPTTVAAPVKGAVGPADPFGTRPKPAPAAGAPTGSDPFARR